MYLPQKGQVLHEICFGSEDAVPRVGFECKDCRDVAKHFVGVTKSMT